MSATPTLRPARLRRAAQGGAPRGGGTLAHPFWRGPCFRI